MEIHDAAGPAAGLITIISYALYYQDIRRGAMRPSQATWLIWTITNWVILLGSKATGAGATLWLPLTYAGGSTIIFAASVKGGHRSANWTDGSCLAGTLVGLILWHQTANPFLAVVLATVAGGAGLIPTIAKLRAREGAESRRSWNLGLAAAAINLGAVDTWTDPVIFFYPVWAAVVTILIWWLVVTYPGDKASYTVGSYPSLLLPTRRCDEDESVA